jgi:acylphosphatase
VSHVARRLVVRGRVQGVNFRAWVRDRATARGVAGWARNAPDGSVEIWLEGDPDAVASLERAVSQGPSHAAVSTIDASDEERRGLHAFERR